MPQSKLTCCSKPYCIHRKDKNINNTTLIVEGRKLYVSKVILGNASPVFRAMYYPKEFYESKSDKIPMGDVKYDDMEKFLSVIHGYIEVNGSNVISLLELADLYNVQDVMKKCEQPLIDAEDITDKDKLIYAEKYQLSIVQAHVLNSMTHQKLQELCADTSEFGKETVEKLLQTALSLLNKHPGCP